MEAMEQHVRNSDTPQPLLRIPDANIRPLCDWGKAAELIASISKLPIDEVRERLGRELQEPGYNVRLDTKRWYFEPHVWSDRLNEFYKHSHAFLFESFAYNGSKGKHTVRRNIAEFLLNGSPVPQRILVFGDGLGFESAYLALAGHSVDYFEPSEAGREFARAVFAENDVTVNQLDTTEDAFPETYDCVVCLDVLEHVPEPRSIVAQISKLLRKDGVLIVHAPFWFVAPEAPTHLRAHMHYSGDWRQLYQPFNLYPIEAFSLWMPLVLRKTEAPPRIPVLAHMRIGVIGALLSVARFWNWPLIAMARMSIKAEHASLDRA